MRRHELDPNDIVTVNVLTRADLMDALVASMQESGWFGRELLVEEVIPTVGPDEPEYHAWTGSHRIEAARHVGLITVPCLVIEHADSSAFVEAGYSPFRDHFWTWRDCVEDGREDISRLEALPTTSLHEAAALMKREVDEGGGRWLQSNTSH